MEVKVTQIKMINQACYSYYDIIRLKYFDPIFSNINRKQARIKRIDDYERICSVIAPFYWVFSFASGYIKEWVGNKYLISDNSFAINKNLLKKYRVLGFS